MQHLHTQNVTIRPRCGHNGKHGGPRAVRGGRSCQGGRAGVTAIQQRQWEGGGRQSSSGRGVRGGEGRGAAGWKRRVEGWVGVYRVGVWYCFVRSALLLAVILCWVDCWIVVLIPGCCWAYSAFSV